MRENPFVPGPRPEPAHWRREQHTRPRPRRASPTPLVARLEIPERVGDGAAGQAKRRDRRGRGIRGPLLPPSAPANRSRAERFDDVVITVIARLERRWSKELRGTEFAVEDVPPSDPAPWEHGSVPLGRYFPADSGQPTRIVVYRRPIEARAYDAEELRELVRDVVVEQVAHMLARTPEEIDPGYTGDD